MKKRVSTWSVFKDFVWWFFIVRGDWNSNHLLIDWYSAYKSTYHYDVQLYKKKTNQVRFNRLHRLYSVMPILKENHNGKN